jgi:methionyl-tRNA formyltransferase
MSLNPLRVYVAGGWGALVTDAVQLALVRDSRTVQVGLDFDAVDAFALRATEPDLLISAAHERMIGASDLEVPTLGSIGIHPSLLPKYRGSHPLWWALKNGEREVGVSIFVLGEGIDSGPILAQRPVPVRPGDSFMSLYVRVVRVIPEMLGELFTIVIETGHLPAGIDQDERAATVYKAPTWRNTLSMRWHTAMRGLWRRE